MNLSAREPSQGKDVLWELELLAVLRRSGIEACLGEPDIVIDIGFGDYGIACKKIYSLDRVEGQMRKGCKQLQPFGGLGLVAINIDDQVPAESLLASHDARSATAFLDNFNRAFIAANIRHIDRFIRGGRCDGVLVSSSTLATLPGEHTSFNVVSQASMWTPRKDASLRMQLLEAAMVNQTNGSSTFRA